MWYMLLTTYPLIATVTLESGDRLLRTTGQFNLKLLSDLYGVLAAKLIGTSITLRKKEK